MASAEHHRAVVSCVVIRPYPAKYLISWSFATQGEDWGPFVVADGKLITGQNPQVRRASFACVVCRWPPFMAGKLIHKPARASRPAWD